MKNFRAEKLILHILGNALWINIHSLPVRIDEMRWCGKRFSILIFLLLQHELPILEVRTIEGYGARWLATGAQFRGFLEPQMEGRLRCCCVLRCVVCRKITPSNRWTRERMDTLMQHSKCSLSLSYFV
jgi:hypothetical protein